VVERQAARPVHALEAHGVRRLVAPERARNLLRQRLVLAELLQQRLVLQVLDVAGIVEGCRRRRRLGRLFLVARFAWEDA
jgi:hypothetical protein